MGLMKTGSAFGKYFFVTLVGLILFLFLFQPVGLTVDNLFNWFSQHSLLDWFSSSEFQIAFMVVAGLTVIVMIVVYTVDDSRGRRMI